MFRWPASNDNSLKGKENRNEKETRPKRLSPQRHRPLFAGDNGRRNRLSVRPDFLEERPGMMASIRFTISVHDSDQLDLILREIESASTDVQVARIE